MERIPPPPDYEERRRRENTQLADLRGRIARGEINEVSTAAIPDAESDDEPIRIRVHAPNTREQSAASDDELPDTERTPTLRSPFSYADAATEDAESISLETPIDADAFIHILGEHSGDLTPANIGRIMERLCQGRVNAADIETPVISANHIGAFISQIKLETRMRQSLTVQNVIDVAKQFA